MSTSSRLSGLSSQFDQSPWLDNLQRRSLGDGSLVALRDEGVKGLTSNPTIFQQAIGGSADYDEQFTSLLKQNRSVEEIYWQMVLDDIGRACEIFASVYAATGGRDGYVSVEVDPGLAHDTERTLEAARRLHDLVHRSNVMIKIPATPAGLPAVSAMIAEGRSVNVTLIFALDRYRAVLDAYLHGLEQLAGDPEADLSQVSSVASFFVSRVDTEVDRRLVALGGDAASDLLGTAAITQAQLAYQIFLDSLETPRWHALAERGARPQRLLWASTGTKNPEYSDVKYVDGLIGPSTVTTLPDATLVAFSDHGCLDRTLDADPDGALRQWSAIGARGIDLDDVAATLEREGLASFQRSFTELLKDLTAKASITAR